MGRQVLPACQHSARTSLEILGERTALKVDEIAEGSQELGVRQKVLHLERGRQHEAIEREPLRVIHASKIDRISANAKSVLQIASIDLRVVFGIEREHRVDERQVQRDSRGKTAQDGDRRNALLHVFVALVHELPELLERVDSEKPTSHLPQMHRRFHRKPGERIVLLEKSTEPNRFRVNRDDLLFRHLRIQSLPYLDLRRRRDDLIAHYHLA